MLSIELIGMLGLSLALVVWAMAVTRLQRRTHLPAETAPRVRQSS